MNKDNRATAQLTRRGFLTENAMGVGIFALASLLAEERLQASPKTVQLQPPTFDLASKQPTQPTRAKAMIIELGWGGHG